VESDPTAELIIAALLSGSRSIPPGLVVPTVLSDDVLRRISAPTTVVIGDREVIYRGGPRAAIARAQKLIPNVHTHLMVGANHMLTIDAPRQLADELLSALG
jgi:pimeloyl-ACP methyl ester carboxylesterase